MKDRASMNILINLLEKNVFSMCTRWHDSQAWLWLFLQMFSTRYYIVFCPHVCDMITIIWVNHFSLVMEKEGISNVA